MSMDGAPADDRTAVNAQAVAYCEALHHADAGVLAEMCDEGFAMRSLDARGAPLRWDKATFTARVAARDAFPSAPSYEILGVDLRGDIAHVTLWVDVPPRRFEDYLGFFKVDGRWRLATKLFRTADGPALEG